MNLRIRTPPSELLERMEDIIYDIKHTKDVSIQTFLIDTFRIYPDLMKEAYRQKRFILHKAVKHNNLHAIHALLKTSWGETYLNVLDKHGNTPMLLALANKNIDIVNKLIAHGASITEFSIMKRIFQLQWGNIS